MAGLKNLTDLFLHHLRDIYSAEKLVLKALPRMAKRVDSKELRQAFETRQARTAVHVERLERVFKMCGKKARGETCEAMQGIIENGKDLMDEAEDPNALDAGLLASAQAADHYEIARYGTLVSWAKQLDLQRAAGLLQETLDEERDSNRALTDLAEAKVNREAA